MQPLPSLPPLIFLISLVASLQNWPFTLRSSSRKSDPLVFNPGKITLNARSGDPLLSRLSPILYAFLPSPEAGVLGPPET